MSDAFITHVIYPEFMTQQTTVTHVPNVTKLSRIQDTPLLDGSDLLDHIKQSCCCTLHTSPDHTSSQASQATQMRRFLIPPLLDPNNAGLMLQAHVRNHDHDTFCAILLIS